MKIYIRPNGEYKDVIVTSDNISIDLGLLNDAECMELAKTLDVAVYQLIGKEEYIKLKDEA